MTSVLPSLRDSRASMSNRGNVSPPPVTLTWTVLSSESSPVVNRKGMPDVDPSTRQGPISFWPLDVHVLRIELVRASGVDDARRQQELGDGQVLDRPFPAAAATSDEVGGQAPVPPRRHRDPDVGSPDAGFREMHLAAQERRQGELGRNEVRRQARCLRSVRAEPETVEPQPRRGQQANVDPPFRMGLDAGRAGDDLVDGAALGLPIDEGRRRDGDRQDQDHDGRKNRQDIAQVTNVSPMPRLSRSRTIALAGQESKDRDCFAAHRQSAIILPGFMML